MADAHRRRAAFEALVRLSEEDGSYDATTPTPTPEEWREVRREVAGRRRAMRDPERIDKVLEEVRRLWQANPDWRLGQLVINAVSEGLADEGAWNALWRAEDDVVVRGCERLLR